EHGGHSPRRRLTLPPPRSVTVLVPGRDGDGAMGGASVDRSILAATADAGAKRRVATYRAPAQTARRARAELAAAGSRNWRRHRRLGPVLGGADWPGEARHRRQPQRVGSRLAVPAAARPGARGRLLPVLQSGGLPTRPRCRHTHRQPAFVVHL